MTRSFGHPITTLPPFVEAVGKFASKGAEKLHRPGLRAATAMVFVRTSPFRPAPKFYRTTFPTPDTMRSRVYAVNMLFISSSNELGEFRAAALSAVPTAIVGSLCTLGVVEAWTRLFQPLRDVDRLEDVARISGNPQS